MAGIWAVLQHVAWEGPGIIATEAGTRGLSVDVRRLDRGDAVPPVDDLAGLIVMGGPMGVDDTNIHPYLLAERRLLREAVARDVPVLGICLGAQLLAAALGARVSKGPTAEIGPGEVQLTGDGLKDTVLGGGNGTLPVMHWHEDTFDIPAGGVHLARSSHYVNQGFRVGRRAYAFQFHIEVDATLATQWAEHLPPMIVIDEGTRAHVERAGHSVICRFFDLAQLR